MQHLLACDTTTSFLALSICSREAAGAPIALRAELSLNAGRRHAEGIFSAAEWMLAQAGLQRDALTHLAVTTGPGSFTGLRIGVAAWKGLAYGLKLPLVGVPTLDALSRSHPWQDASLCVMLDAKMSEVFTATYRFDQGRRNKIRPDAVIPPSEAIVGLPPETLFLGDGALRYAGLIREGCPEARILGEEYGAPTGKAVACEAFALLDAGVSVDAALVEPVYLRKTQAEYNRDRAAAASA